MKKTTIAILGLILSFGMSAQEESSFNSMFIGGQAGYGSDKQDGGSDISNYVVGPTFAYMFNAKMGLGANFMYIGGKNKANNAQGDVTKTSGWYIQPFFRYYMGGGDKFKFYSDLALNYGSGSTKSENNAGNSSETKYNSFGVGLNPGCQFWFVDNWSIAANIGLLAYQNTTDNPGENNESTRTQFGIAADFTSLGFSLFYHF